MRYVMIVAIAMCFGGLVPVRATDDDDAMAALALATAMRAKRPVVPPKPEPPAPTPTGASWGYRTPHGHTHTCAAGHTWDHDANPTHVCRFCGQSQYVVDVPSRMVLVQMTGGSTTPAAPDVLYQLSPSGASGCVGGNCPTTSTIRRGLGIFR